MNLRKPDPEKLREMFGEEAERWTLPPALKALWDSTVAEDHSSFHDTLRGLK